MTKKTVVERRTSSTVAVRRCRSSNLLAALSALLAQLEAADTKAVADRSCAAMTEVAKDAVIHHALGIMEARLRAPGAALTSPAAVRDYLRLRLANAEHEIFVVLFLTSQNALIACEEMFRGTLTQTSVYPREVVKAALKHNAAAVIFAHPHPSGIAEPSRADELLTNALKQALQLVDIRTLDHFVIAADKVISFAEKGLI